MATFNRVDLDAHHQLSEFVAGGAIRPGDLLARTGVKDVVKSNTDGGGGLFFAMHDRLQGKTIADNYASSDRVQCFAPRKGSQVWAWLADEENVNAGAPLTANGDGSLRAAVIGTDHVVAFTEEALDLTGAAGDARIVVRIN
jgi:hypothetical protein